jgi:hypothetical protein
LILLHQNERIVQLISPKGIPIALLKTHAKGHEERGRRGRTREKRVKT